MYSVDCQMFLIFCFSYLIGSFPTAFLIGKSKNIDIRRYGSGNVGATNSARVLGKKIALAVLLIDILKGFLPLYLSNIYFSELDKKEIYILIAGFSVLTGHIFPLWLRFKGGKGVATMSGVLMALSPLQLGFALAIFTIVLIISKMVSMASIVSVFSMILTFFLSFSYEESYPILYFYCCSFVLILFAHKGNIKRIFSGTESKVGHNFFQKVNL